MVGASLSVSFLCSVLEAVLLSVNHPFVALLQGRGDRAGDLLARMKRRIDEPIAAILTLNTVAHTVGAAWAGAIVARTYGDVWIGAFSAVLTLAVLVFSEIIPKTIGATFWKGLARPSAHVLRAMVVVMKPVIVPLGLVSRWTGAKRERQATVSRAEIEVLAEIGRREGAIDEDEFQVMSNVMQLDEITAGEVMTPRIDIVAVPADASVREAINVMLDRGKLRLPVYEESLDRIVGVLLARDLWRADREGRERVREVARSAHFSPAVKPVEDLIQEMRAKKTKMVVVLDEFGGTAGLVTWQDLIEEIVGEFHDEHEVDEPQDFRELADGRTIVRGGTPVRDLEERLGIALGEEYGTVGGYVFGALDRVGRPGDSVAAGGGRFRIARVRRRRIEYVIYEPGEPEASED